MPDLPLSPPLSTSERRALARLDDVITGWSAGDPDLEERNRVTWSRLLAGYYTAPGRTRSLIASGATPADVRVDRARGRVARAAYAAARIDPTWLGSYPDPRTWRPRDAR